MKHLIYKMEFKLETEQKIRDAYNLFEEIFTELDDADRRDEKVMRVYDKCDEVYSHMYEFIRAYECMSERDLL